MSWKRNRTRKNPAPARKTNQAISTNPTEAVDVPTDSVKGYVFVTGYILTKGEGILRRGIINERGRERIRNSRLTAKKVSLFRKSQ